LGMWGIRGAGSQLSYTPMESEALDFTGLPGY
jgi:hypothetical protein